MASRLHKKATLSGGVGRYVPWRLRFVAFPFVVAFWWEATLDSISGYQGLTLQKGALGQFGEIAPYLVRKVLQIVDSGRTPGNRHLAAPGDERDQDGDDR